MKTSQVICGLLIFLLLTLPAAAEFYRYKDEHGNVIYTDDLSKVPPDQRTQVKSYEESQYKSPPVTEVEGTENEETDVNEDIKEQNRLLEKEKVLSREHKDLMAEKEKLIEVKKEAVTPEQIKNYNKSIIEFNTRIKAYEEKRDAYSTEIKAFNDRIAAKQQAKQKEQ